MLSETQSALQLRDKKYNAQIFIHKAIVYKQTINNHTHIHTHTQKKTKKLGTFWYWWAKNTYTQDHAQHTHTHTHTHTHRIACTYSANKEHTQARPRPCSLNIDHEILKCSPLINRTATSGSIRLVTPLVSLETWREDYDYRACTYLVKAATLKKIEHYQKTQANNMAYSHTSLNHMQQKTDLLTIAVISKRRRWTANMAVTWIVSSGEHFCCCFLPFFLFLFLNRVRAKYPGTF